MTVAALSLLECYFFMRRLKSTPLVGPLFSESFFPFGQCIKWNRRVDNHSVIHALGHVQRCLMSRLYGRTFAKSPFTRNSRGRVVVSWVDGSGPCSQKSTCQRWSRVHATPVKSLLVSSLIWRMCKWVQPYKIHLKSKSNPKIMIQIYLGSLIRLYSRSDKTYVTPWIFVIYFVFVTFSIFL